MVLRRDQGQDEREPSDRYPIVNGRRAFLVTALAERDFKSRNWEVGGDFDHTLAGGSVINRAPDAPVMPTARLLIAS